MTDLEKQKVKAVADMLGANQSGDIVRGLLRRYEETQRDFTALQRALVGQTGLSAIEEARRLRALHPSN